MRRSKTGANLNQVRKLRVRLTCLHRLMRMSCCCAPSWISNADVAEIWQGLWLSILQRIVSLWDGAMLDASS